MVNLLKTTEQFISGKSYRPLTYEQLVERLCLPEQHKALFEEVLQTLVEKHVIEEVENRFQAKRSDSGYVKGVIKMHFRGFGFVHIENSKVSSQDIFIPKHLTQNAVDGDLVEVLINTDVVSEKGPEGKVVAILSRSRTHMAGILQQEEDGGGSVYVPLLGVHQKVLLQPTQERILKAGDRIVMEVVEWGSKERATLCRFSHYLGNIFDPSCDVTAAIEEFGIRSDFPNEVVQEAQALGQRVSQSEIQKREDLRHLTTLTIDPDTAKDFDDALSVELLEGGGYRLGVHIADVSHYVQPGSALDEEALLRCNSTYFPRLCVPMLPGALSENLCSLKANVNRLTVSVFMQIDGEGNVTDYRITKGVIKSAKRFTYKEAKAVLDGEKQSKHLPMLQQMVELCALLKKKRYERGSLEFSLPEIVILVDEAGVPSKTDCIAYDITHQMVEEFMLKANETVAIELHKRGKHLPYRIHDVPADESLRDFALVASAFGFRLPDLPNPQDMQKLFEQANKTAYGSYLASSYIRRMRLAAYSADNIGHYGLSLTHYCHFTSPIRRYIDLVIHRILFDGSDDLTYLQQVALQSSEKERISAKAENSVVTLKKLRLLEQMQNKDPYREYDAIITQVKNFGFYFEMIDLMLEGFIHISEIGDDYYLYDEAEMRLRGDRSGAVYCPGDKISVILKSADLIYQQSHWYLALREPLAARSNKQKKKEGHVHSEKRGNRRGKKRG